MQVANKTIKKLQALINEETEYRSGPGLVEFFNELGFNDSYGQGFPSRSTYTYDRLKQINGTANLDKCIKNLFDPRNFIGQVSKLDEFINQFNEYLAFDKWLVVRNGTEITFKRASNIILNDDKLDTDNDVEDFLEREFKDISIDALGLDQTITPVLESRFKEIKKCFSADASLSVIFIAGSTLEGILLGMASKYPRKFNTAKSAPINSRTGKVKSFPDWTLSQFIDTAREISFLGEDVKKFSHALRDFRNYIHPYQQVSSGFNPDHNTAKICFQVLKAAIDQLSKTTLNPPFE